MQRPVDYVIEPLSSHHDRAAFSCGEPSLDNYIRRQAGQDMKRDLAVCYVLCPRDAPTIIGYYTLSATSIELTALPPEMAKRAGRYQRVPAILLGRLAVDTRFARQGIGSILLLNALRRALRSGIGVKLVIVDALNQNAVTFYQRHGFQQVQDSPPRLYMPLHTVRGIFPDDDIPPNSMDVTVL